MTNQIGNAAMAQALAAIDAAFAPNEIAANAWDRIASTAKYCADNYQWIALQDLFVATFYPPPYRYTTWSQVWKGYATNEELIALSMQ